MAPAGQGASEGVPPERRPGGGGGGIGALADRLRERFEPEADHRIVGGEVGLAERTVSDFGMPFLSGEVSHVYWYAERVGLGGADTAALITRFESG